MMPDDRPQLTAEEKQQARLVFEGKAPNGQLPCLHCGGIHLRACRRVKAITWHTDGSTTSAEYWPDGTWDESGITWPEEAYEDDENDDEES
jgi:hypothetical protein